MPPLATTLIIFDLDGTLIDTAEDLAAAMNHVLEREGLRPLPTARVRHLIGRGARAMLQEGCAANGAHPDAASMNRLHAAFIDYYFDNIAVHSAPFDGAIGVLGRLQEAHATLAICTNKRESGARRLLTALGLAERFNLIVGRDTVAAAKPDPAPVRHCMSQSGKDNAVFIGDSDFDIIAATRAGAPCLIHTGGYGPLELTSECDGLFDAFASLPGLLDRALDRLRQRRST